METTQSSQQIIDDASLAPTHWQERLFAHSLRSLKGGSLTVHFPSGSIETIGDRQGPCSKMVINNKAFYGKLLASGSVGLGEAYTEGDWDTPDLSAVLTLLAKNQAHMGRLRKGFNTFASAANRLYHLARRNTLERSRQNIQEHYDLSNDFYQTFLDPSLSYSSAIFQEPTDTLEQAQYRKLDRILDLAGIQPNSSVLEIGSGWGALAIHAVKTRDCTVKTITLSDEQFALAKERIEQTNLSNKIEIALEDYRIQDSSYDYIVSVEMLEAVGREYLELYFEVVQRCLKPGGTAVIQVITIPDDRYEGYSKRCDWIQKHIFPGGHLPSPGALKQAIAKAGSLELIKMEGFGLSYAETLRRWQKQFNAASQRVGDLGFDSTFQRKWNYYFSYCEAGFETEIIDVKHVVIKKTNSCS